MRFNLLALATMTAVAVSSNTKADIVTFTDRSAFLTATGATDATWPLPNLGRIPGGTAASQAVGSVTFSITSPATELFIGAAGVPGIVNNDLTLRLPGPDIGLSGRENLNATVSGPAFSLGFDFVEPQNDPNVNPSDALGGDFVESQFTVTPRNLSTIIYLL